MPPLARLAAWMVPVQVLTVGGTAITCEASVNEGDNLTWIAATIRRESDWGTVGQEVVIGSQPM